jgi:hypothetical protein
LTAVDLDHEARLITKEVCDVRAKGNLPTKFRALELSRAQDAPKLALSVRHPSPQ